MMDDQNGDLSMVQQGSSAVGTEKQESLQSQHHAATRIQAFFRGCVCRAKVSDMVALLIMEMQAATTISTETLGTFQSTDDEISEDETQSFGTNDMRDEGDSERDIDTDHEVDDIENDSGDEDESVDDGESADNGAEIIDGLVFPSKLPPTYFSDNDEPDTSILQNPNLVPQPANSNNSQQLPPSAESSTPSDSGKESETTSGIPTPGLVESNSLKLGSPSDSQSSNINDRGDSQRSPRAEATPLNRPPHIEESKSTGSAKGVETLIGCLNSGSKNDELSRSDHATPTIPPKPNVVGTSNSLTGASSAGLARPPLAETSATSERSPSRGRPPRMETLESGGAAKHRNPPLPPRAATPTSASAAAKTSKAQSWWQGLVRENSLKFGGSNHSRVMFDSSDSDSESDPDESESDESDLDDEPPIIHRASPSPTMVSNPIPSKVACPIPSNISCSTPSNEVSQDLSKKLETINNASTITDASPSTKLQTIDNASTITDESPSTKLQTIDNTSTITDASPSAKLRAIVNPGKTSDESPSAKLKAIVNAGKTSDESPSAKLKAIVNPGKTRDESPSARLKAMVNAGKINQSPSAKFKTIVTASKFLSKTRVKASVSGAIAEKMKQLDEEHENNRSSTPSKIRPIVTASPVSERRSKYLLGTASPSIQASQVEIVPGDISGMKKLFLPQLSPDDIEGQMTLDRTKNVDLVAHQAILHKLATRVQALARGYLYRKKDFESMDSVLISLQQFREKRKLLPLNVTTPTVESGNVEMKPVVKLEQASKQLPSSSETRKRWEALTKRDTSSKEVPQRKLSGSNFAARQVLRHQSATKIQAVVRGRSVRSVNYKAMRYALKWINDYKRKVAEAKQKESKYRSAASKDEPPSNNLALKQMLIKDSAIKIQCLARGYLARRVDYKSMMRTLDWLQDYRRAYYRSHEEEKKEEEPDIPNLEKTWSFLEENNALTEVQSSAGGAESTERLLGNRNDAKKIENCLQAKVNVMELLYTWDWLKRKDGKFDVTKMLDESRVDNVSLLGLSKWVKANGPFSLNFKAFVMDAYRGDSFEARDVEVPKSLDAIALSNNSLRKLGSGASENKIKGISDSQQTDMLTNLWKFLAWNGIDMNSFSDRPTSTDLPQAKSVADGTIGDGKPTIKAMVMYYDFSRMYHNSTLKAQLVNDDNRSAINKNHDLKHATPLWMQSASSNYAMKTLDWLHRRGIDFDRVRVGEEATQSDLASVATSTDNGDHERDVNKDESVAQQTPSTRDLMKTLSWLQQQRVSFVDANDDSAAKNHPFDSEAKFKAEVAKLRGKSGPPSAAHLLESLSWLRSKSRSGTSNGAPTYGEMLYALSWVNKQMQKTEKTSGGSEDPTPSIHDLQNALRWLEEKGYCKMNAHSGSDIDVVQIYRSDDSASQESQSIQQMVRALNWLQKRGFARTSDNSSASRWLEKKISFDTNKGTNENSVLMDRSAGYPSAREMTDTVGMVKDSDKKEAKPASFRRGVKSLKTPSNKDMEEAINFLQKREKPRTVLSKESEPDIPSWLVKWRAARKELLRGDTLAKLKKRAERLQRRVPPELLEMKMGLPPSTKQVVNALGELDRDMKFNKEEMKTVVPKTNEYGAKPLAKKFSLHMLQKKQGNNHMPEVKSESSGKVSLGMLAKNQGGKLLPENKSETPTKLSLGMLAKQQGDKLLQENTSETSAKLSLGMLAKQQGDKRLPENKSEASAPLKAKWALAKNKLVGETDPKPLGMKTTTEAGKNPLTKADKTALIKSKWAMAKNKALGKDGPMTFSSAKNIKSKWQLAKNKVLGIEGEERPSWLQNRVDAVTRAAKIDPSDLAKMEKLAQDPKKGGKNSKKKGKVAPPSNSEMNEMRDLAEKSGKKKGHGKKDKDSKKKKDKKTLDQVDIDAKNVLTWLTDGKADTVEDEAYFKKLDSILPKKEGQSKEARAKEMAKTMKWVKKDNLELDPKPGNPKAVTGKEESGSDKKSKAERLDAKESEKTPSKKEDDAASSGEKKKKPSSKDVGDEPISQEAKDLENAMNWLTSKKRETVEDANYFEKLDAMMGPIGDNTIKARAKAMAKALQWVRKTSSNDDEKSKAGSKKEKSESKSTKAKDKWKKMKMKLDESKKATGKDTDGKGKSKSKDKWKKLKTDLQAKKNSEQEAKKSPKSKDKWKKLKVDLSEVKKKSEIEPKKPQADGDTETKGKSKSKNNWKKLKIDLSQAKKTEEESSSQDEATKEGAKKLRALMQLGGSAGPVGKAGKANSKWKSLQKGLTKAKEQTLNDEMKNITNVSELDSDAKNALQWLKERSDDIPDALYFKKINVMVTKKPDQSLEERAREFAKALKVLRKRGVRMLTKEQKEFERALTREKDLENAVTWLKAKAGDADESKVEDAEYFEKLDKIIPVKSDQTPEKRAEDMVKMLGWVRKKGLTLGKNA